MTHVLVDRHIHLVDGSSFEFLVSQLQLSSCKILAVQDGTTLRVFDSSNRIPPYLKLELVKKNELTRTEEFHYRNTSTDELWVFFHQDLHLWIQEGRHDTFRLEVSRGGVRSPSQTFERGPSPPQSVEGPSTSQPPRPKPSQVQISAPPVQQPFDIDSDPGEDLSGLSFQTTDSENQSPIEELIVSRSHHISNAIMF